MHVNIEIIARTHAARSVARCGASTRGVLHRCRLQCTELPPLKRARLKQSSILTNEAGSWRRVSLATEGNGASNCLEEVRGGSHGALHNLRVRICRWRQFL